MYEEQKAKYSDVIEIFRELGVIKNEYLTNDEIINLLFELFDKIHILSKNNICEW